MPAKHADLHESAPDKSLVALLLLIDVIHDVGFPEADQLLIRLDQMPAPPTNS